MKKTRLIPGFPTLKGITTTNLVFYKEDFIDAIERLERTPHEEIDTVPRGWTIEKWVQDTREYYERYIYLIDEEIERRRKYDYDGVQKTNGETINAIKERAKIIDVLSKYTEVITFKNGWSFKCTRHGQDKHPSGKIYPETNTWHCWGCNHGGDVFEAVMWFERVDFITALKQLARELGISLSAKSKYVQYE
jgi:hypothetical protein